MREKYTLYDPYTGATKTVYTKIARDALIGQGWELKE